MKTLQELRTTIGANVDLVDEKQYSHNIISVCLRQIAEEHGVEAANEVIDIYELEELGWKKQ